MSLFGTSPDDSSLGKPASRPQSSSLFDGEPRPQLKSGDSLFADDTNVPSDSLWAMPTPKKAARADLIKNLLPGSGVPESYVDAFDAILDSGERMGGNISSNAVMKLLQNSGIGAAEQTKILNIVAPGGTAQGGMERSTFNVLLALVGLELEGDDATLDGVDERRKSMPHAPYSITCDADRDADLPAPKLPYLDNLKTAKVSESTPPRATVSTTPPVKAGSSSPTKSRQLRRDSLNDPEVDPWASQTMPKSTTRPVLNESTPSQINATTAARPIIAQTAPSNTRTTSNFTTHSEDLDSSASKMSGSIPSDDPSGAGGGWGSFGASNQGFSNGVPSGLGSSGFAPGGDDPSNPSGRPSRAIGSGRTTSRGVDEVVNIALLPEKEGMFMFQHRNYEVKSARRASSVIRRYSDFVWLLDCLHKRYPFRQLPLLPPKTLAGRCLYNWIQHEGSSNPKSSQRSSLVLGRYIYRETQAWARTIY